MTQTPCNSMEHWNNLRLCVIWQQQADKVLHVENRCKFIDYFWKTTRRTHSLLKRAEKCLCKTYFGVRCACELFSLDYQII